MRPVALCGRLPYEASCLMRPVALCGQLPYPACHDADLHADHPQRHAPEVEFAGTAQISQPPGRQDGRDDVQRPCLRGGRATWIRWELVGSDGLWWDQGGGIKGAPVHT